MNKSTSGTAATIAVVEDDENVMDAVGLVLQANGWLVDPYVTGEAFLSASNRSAPDCVILDPHLPGIDGDEVAEVLEQKQIPFIVLTARPDSLLATKVVGRGAHTMLTKPVTAEHLIQHVEAAIQQKNDIQ